MSETLTIGTGTVDVLGTYLGAVAYVEAMYGAKYTTWLALAAAARKQTLAQAVRFINAQAWTDDYDTHAERDALEAFQFAEYELAVMISDDDTVTDAADQGSNIASLGAGSARISFFNQSTKNAPRLPPVLMRLVGSYLAAATLTGPDGGESLDSCSDNPFSSGESY